MQEFVFVIISLFVVFLIFKKKILKLLLNNFKMSNNDTVLEEPIKSNSDDIFKTKSSLNNLNVEEEILTIMRHKNIRGTFAKGSGKDVFVPDSDNLIDGDSNQDIFIPYYEVVIYVKDEFIEYDCTTTIHKFKEQDIFKSNQSSQAFIDNLLEEKNKNKEFELILVSKTALGEIVKYLLFDKKGTDIRRGRDFESYLLKI